MGSIHYIFPLKSYLTKPITDCSDLELINHWNFSTKCLMRLQGINIDLEESNSGIEYDKKALFDLRRLVQTELACRGLPSSPFEDGFKGLS